MTLGRTIPALPAQSVAVAVTFWHQRLGFEPVHHDAGFAVLRRDDAVVHLWEAADTSWTTRSGDGPGPVRSGAESFLAGTASCRIEVTELDDLFAEMRAAGVLHPATPSVAGTDFGTREFAVTDGDGNLVTFHTWVV